MSLSTVSWRAATRGARLRVAPHQRLCYAEIGQPEDDAELVAALLVERQRAIHLGDDLVEGRGVQISALLRLHKFLDYLPGSDHPGQAYPGSQYLGKCAQIDDVAGECSIGVIPEAVIQQYHRWQVLPFIAQLPVRIVLDDGDVVLARQLDETSAAFGNQGHAARVLEVGHRVDELGATGPDTL